MDEPPSQDATSASSLSRRAVLGLTAGAAVGAGAGFGAARWTDPPEVSAGEHTHPFHGEHQAGITTPVQQHLYLATFDLVDSADRDTLVSLLEDWTAAAARMTRGLDVSESGAVGGPALAPPDDTGEALGLGPHSLTVTFGFGPSLFDPGRFGLEDRRPESLEPLPSFAFDLIEDATSDGDLCIQACADDAQVSVHAIRNLSRIAFGRAQVRWTQLGFGRSSRTARGQQTPRNLFGFKDGTANILAGDDEALRRFVWVDDGPEWMHGGTYLVTRKIAMLIESWDRVKLQEQEDIIGRSKGQGAPLSGGGEFDDPDFDLRASDGPAIPADAHVRLAHPDFHGGTRMLRRGYNFVEGNNDLGQVNAGLFFISFQRSPSQFVEVQTALKDDPMNEYVRHVGSALFAVPRGIGRGEFVGQPMFA